MVFSSENQVFDPVVFEDAGNDFYDGEEPDDPEEVSDVRFAKRLKTNKLDKTELKRLLDDILVCI